MKPDRPVFSIPFFQFYRKKFTLSLLTAVLLSLFISCISTENNINTNAPNTTGESQTSIENSETTEATNNAGIIRSVIETFDSLVTNMSVENALSESYRQVRPHLTGGSIRIRSFNENIESPLERSRIQYNNDRSNLLIFLHNSILDTFGNVSLPALGELARNLPYMETFINKGSEFNSIYENPINLYLSQMDGVYLQTIFIESFASADRGLSETQYEEYLTQSRSIDDFSSYSLFALGVDREIIYSMLTLGSQLERNDVSTEYFASEMLRLGQNIEENLTEAQDLYSESGESTNADGDIAQRTYYIALTSARTYRQFGGMILDRITSLVSASELNTIEAYLQFIDQTLMAIDRYIADGEIFRNTFQNNFVSEL